MISNNEGFTVGRHPADIAQYNMRCYSLLYVERDCQGKHGRWRDEETQDAVIPTEEAAARWNELRYCRLELKQQAAFGGNIAGSRRNLNYITVEVCHKGLIPSIYLPNVSGSFVHCSFVVKNGAVVGRWQKLRWCTAWWPFVDVESVEQMLP